jgi:hypothetical protein
VVLVSPRRANEIGQVIVALCGVFRRLGLDPVPAATGATWLVRRMERDRRREFAGWLVRGGAT